MNQKKRIILIRNAKSFDFGGGERFPVFLAEILNENNRMKEFIDYLQS